MSERSSAVMSPEVDYHLPDDAQEIYKVAFHNAWTQYSDALRGDGDSLAQMCNRVAWTAVKKKYKTWWRGQWRKTGRNE